jgi:acylphosphatase
MVTRDAAAGAACWKVRVTGRVQGVGYREACVQQARALGLSGWVRNRRDGSVEAMLEGDADRLARMRDWLRRGPPAARVTAVTVIDAPSAGVEGFERRPTE